MRKEFNDTGLCIPEKHYMVNPSEKIRAIFQLVEKGKYFVINRPRQYGKTTTLYLLERELQKQSGYLPLSISFEGFGSESYRSEQSFIESVLNEFRAVSRFYQWDDVLRVIDAATDVTKLYHLGQWFTTLMHTVKKRIVLMIDEVDQSSNNQLFLDFLGLLRSKYLSAAQGKDATFHSVILAGVHDVKTLKLKIRPESEQKYNSPWNIAVDFTIDLSFNPQEIGAMLTEYAQTTGVTMDVEAIAHQLHTYTSGYPFLVSKLCKILDEDIWPSQEGKIWRAENVEEAVNRLLKLQITNFDSLIKNLENHAVLYGLVEQIVLFDEQVSYSQYSPVMNLGILYGIFTRKNGGLDIHNQIYRELIYDYMTANFQVKSLTQTELRDYTFQAQYIRPDGSLNMEQVVRKFQEFMKQQYSRRDTAFVERNGRLIFLAFLKPIINGHGYEFKEPQISEEKQLDIAITYDRQKYIVELKIWRGEEAHQRGLRQLHDYLDRTGSTRGYLVIFDFTQKGQKDWKQETLQVDQKHIFAVWV